jgi:hypothetical protein
MFRKVCTFIALFTVVICVARNNNRLDTIAMDPRSLKVITRIRPALPPNQLVSRSANCCADHTCCPADVNVCCGHSCCPADLTGLCCGNTCCPKSTFCCGTKGTLCCVDPGRCPDAEEPCNDVGTFECCGSGFVQCSAGGVNVFTACGAGTKCKRLSPQGVFCG